MTRDSVDRLRQQSRGSDKSQLLKKCHTRLSRALELGFNIEAIALIETLMSDRLESLLSTVDSEPVEIKTLGQHLARVERFGVLDQFVIVELRIWNRKRNLAVHELVKIRNSSDTDWNARIKFVREAAREGEQLLKSLKTETARIKRCKTRDVIESA